MQNAKRKVKDYPPVFHFSFCISHFAFLFVCG